MDDPQETSGRTTKVSSGPLRVHEYEGELFVAGFGLWIPVESEEEGLELITELENQGYRMCH
jgi:hypothetical protein